MRSKHSLRSLYARTLGSDQLETVEHLFHKIVGIRSASIPDIVTELEDLKASGCDDFQRIERLYRYVRDLKPPIDDLK